MRLEFARPERWMRDEVLKFRDAFTAAGEKIINGSGGLDFYPDFETWFSYHQKCQSGEIENTFCSEIWLVRSADSSELVGILDIRPTLTEDKRHYGHLGYAVLPGRRGKGVATAMLAWAVDTLRRAGVTNIYASVYADNGPSIKVLEKSGFLQKGMYKEEDSGKEIVQYVNVC
ncbi:GNAT family N-acetyltransferase [Ruminococcaceae bacterium OttesenSCG-928-D13]|nr:GNAT family N-acetyltransferase [Ruminococcaceae bacterium OttesenSCG-928-D13]